MDDGEEESPGNLHRVEAVLGSRFPGINKTLGEFNFARHYGAIVKEVKSGGERFTHDLDKVTLHEGDTLVLCCLLYTSISEFVLLEAKDLLSKTRLRPSQIATMLGFANHDTFSRWFRRHTGEIPTEWR